MVFMWPASARPQRVCARGGSQSMFGSAAQFSTRCSGDGFRRVDFLEPSEWRFRRRLAAAACMTFEQGSFVERLSVRTGWRCRHGGITSEYPVIATPCGVGVDGLGNRLLTTWSVPAPSSPGEIGH
jgi:hypothetical protein